MYCFCRFLSRKTSPCPVGVARSPRACTVLGHWSGPFGTRKSQSVSPLSGPSQVGLAWFPLLVRTGFVLAGLGVSGVCCVVDIRRLSCGDSDFTEFSSVWLGGLGDRPAQIWCPAELLDALHTAQGWGGPVCRPLSGSFPWDSQALGRGAGLCGPASLPQARPVCLPAHSGTFPSEPGVCGHLPWWPAGPCPSHL